MVKLFGVAVAALLALVPPARAAGDAGKDAGRNTAAVELSRLVLTPEGWAKTTRAASAQVASQMGEMMKAQGATLAPEFEARFAEEFSALMPYQEIVDQQAGLLAKYYTEAEIRQLVAFYKTPLGQKAIRVMPEVTQDVTGWSFSIIQQRMPAAMERLAPLIKAPAAAGK